MDKLNDLKDQEVEAKLRLTSIQNKIRKVEKQNFLPSFKKKYQGKYFKFKNSYSCPEKESDYWYMYICITKVTNISSMEGFTFETDKYGKVSFEADRSIYESSCQIQITKKEFDTAYRRLLKNIRSICEHTE